MKLKLTILKQTAHYIAVHKPSGLVVYADDAASQNISCQKILEAQLKGRKIFPIHRLDKQTCGILVYAFSPGVAAKLGEAFRGRVTKKKYLAIVHGVPPKEGSVDTPLTKNKSKEVQSAKTLYTRLTSHTLTLQGEERSYSLLRVEPKTGRYHQIRRHLREIDHPIVGDPDYGNAWNNRVLGAEFGVKRTLLSAVYLSFPDPNSTTGFIYLSTKPDADFLKIAQAWNWKIN